MAESGKGRIRYVQGSPRDDLGFSALLIRPDGVVAWASERAGDRASDRVMFERAAARWFGSAETPAASAPAGRR